MSAKCKSHGKDRHDWSVRTIDDQYHLILGARLTVRADGGHVFADRKGVKASFGPGQVAKVLREDLTGPRETPEVQVLAPARGSMTDPYAGLGFDDDPRKPGTAKAVSGA